MAVFHILCALICKMGMVLFYAWEGCCETQLCEVRKALCHLLSTHWLCLLPVACHTALTYPARYPAGPCSPGHEILGSLTQLRRAQVPPWTWPLPLGASVSCSMFCQAQGPGLREVDVPTAGSHPGSPLCPHLCQDLTMPGIHAERRAWEGRPASDWGLPSSLYPDVSGEGRDRM